MDITRKNLEERLQALTAQKDQALAQVNAIEGARMTVRELLVDLDKDETIEEPVEEEAPGQLPEEVED